MMRSMSVIVTVVFLLSGVPGAWADQEEWEPDLVWQLEEEHACVVSYLTNVIERKVDERLVVFARAHCDDGRAFDAVREDVFSLFVVRPCKLDVQTC